MKIKNYLANPRLKKTDVTLQLTEDQIREFILCSQNPIYFIEQYVKIITLDKGFINISLYPFQKQAIDDINQNRQVILKAGRQLGKCFFINTQVTLKNTVTGEIWNTTIGEFYEYISRMQIMQQNNDSVAFSHKKYSQNEDCRIYSNVPEHTSSVGVFVAQSIRESQRNQQSWIPTWRKTFPIFQEICWESGPQYPQKSNRKSFEKQQRYNNNRVLVEENEWKFKRGAETSFGKANDLFSTKMHTKTWRNRREKNLDNPTKKVGEEFQKTKLFSNISTFIPQSDGDLPFRASVFRNLGKIGNDWLQKQRISSYLDKWKNNFTRFYRFVNQKSDRIRWRILASWKHSEPQKRKNERAMVTERWISATQNSRKGFQTKSRKSHTGLPDLSSTIERKFVESYSIQNWQVKSDKGWVPVTHLHKTVKYKEWIVKTEFGKELICADDHIVFDSKYNQVFVKNLKKNISKILTENGAETVVDVYETSNSSHMFDLTVDSEEHRFYTNGILSHNTTMVVLS